VEAVCVNNLPKVATQWNSGTTRESNRGPRARIPSAQATEPLSDKGVVFVCRIRTVQSAHRTHPSMFCFHSSAASLSRSATISADVPAIPPSSGSRHSHVWIFMTKTNLGSGS